MITYIILWHNNTFSLANSHCYKNVADKPGSVYFGGLVKNGRGYLNKRETQMYRSVAKWIYSSFLESLFLSNEKQSLHESWLFLLLLLVSTASQRRHLSSCRFLKTLLSLKIRLSTTTSAFGILTHELRKNRIWCTLSFVTSDELCEEKGNILFQIFQQFLLTK